MSDEWPTLEEIEEVLRRPETWENVVCIVHRDPVGLHPGRKCDDPKCEKGAEE